MGEEFCINTANYLYDNISFPLFRSVFTPMTAQDLVTVQPMSLPQNILHYLDFKITNRKQFKFFRGYGV